MPIVLLGTLFAVLVLAAAARAQESNETKGTQPHPQQTAADTTARQAPPLLYSKHHRGLYKNARGRVVIDATPQSPPLETDDPGVPDKGEWEINLATQADFSKELSAFELLFVDANYGLLPRIFGHALPTQLAIEFPFAGAKAPNESMRVGIGPADVGLKFNFYSNDRHGMYMALYPQIEFAVPGTDAVEKDLAEPGQTFILPLLVQKEFKHMTIVVNAALDQPLHDPDRRTTGTLGLGAGRAMTQHVSAMAEARFTSTFDLAEERLFVVNVGLMRRLRDDVTLFGNVGRSLFSDEGSEHTYVGMGVKLQDAPKK
jgi:hypothetical protein